MGLLSKLGGAVKEGIRNGAINGLLNATGNSAVTGTAGYNEYEYDANGNIKGVSSQYREHLEDIYGKHGRVNSYYKSVSGLSYNKEGIRTNSGSNKGYPTKYSNSSQNYADTSYSSALTQMEENEKYNIALTKKQQTNKSEKEPQYKSETEGIKDVNGLIFRDTSDTYKNYKDNNQIKAKEDINSDIYKLKLPDWSYADFINERSIWQKGLSSVLDEPGWFYFKIFFDFNTNHGLFGGLLNYEYLSGATNSAAKYLYTNKNLHKNIKARDRITSLYKFASILSYINSNSPWYFKSIKGLNKVLVPVLDDFSKERFIEIETSPDAVDMRLSTLMSLYNYACFDVFYDKEIIPENLRKFNMSIILFQTPLRYLHTSYMTHEKKEFLGINTDSFPYANKLFGVNKDNNSIVKYKNMLINDGETGNFANTMSMKIISLYGCEFDKETIGSMIPGDISNESPFQLGKNTIKITYTEATEHTMNEFYAMMFGSDGFYFNQYNNFLSGELTGLYNSSIQNWKDKQISRYKTLQETFGNGAEGGTILGIIDSPKSYKEAIDATESIMNGIGESQDLLTSLGTNFALGLLGSSKNTNAPQGNLYGDYGIGSAYYKDKLEMLKNGVHERTTAPYYYDPYTGARVDLHKSRNYTAYNFKNDISSIKQFDVGNWLNNTSTNLGSSLNNGLRDVFYGGNPNTTAPYKPNEYNSSTAQQIDTKKYEGIGKNHDMVDDPNSWDRVEKPYKT